MMDEDGIPETVGDEPVMATDDLRDAVLKGADRGAQILETDLIGSRGHALYAIEKGEALAGAEPLVISLAQSRGLSC